jgi:hypothetical protein
VKERAALSAPRATFRRDDPRGHAGEVLFHERLLVPWWYWPLPLLAAVIAAAEVHSGYPGVRSWLPYVTIIPLTAIALGMLGTIEVSLTDTELTVGKARMPRRFVGEVEVISGAGRRRALGPELDPAAFVKHRGWVRSLVRMETTDPADPAPYWVFSTRNAERLAELLRGGGS